MYEGDDGPRVRGEIKKGESDIGLKISELYCFSKI